jgi:hypothetical protein
MRNFTIRTKQEENPGSRNLKKPNKFRLAFLINFIIVILQYINI